MAITKRPKRDTKATTLQDADLAAEAFIAGTVKAAPAQAVSKKTPIMLRFDPAVLRRVDEAAKRRGISRSAWIQFTVSRALDQGEG